MKKILWMVSLMLVCTVMLFGCATSGDIEKIQASEAQINAKADQALKAAEDAKASAMRADEAAKAAEERARQAEERAKIAEEAKSSDVVFKNSMKK